MGLASDSYWKYLVFWVRIYFAFHYLESGLYYVIFGYVPDFSRAGLVGPYMAAMADIGFYQFIKYLEVVLGTMLLLNIAMPIVLIITAGISTTIIYLNLVVSPHPRQTFTGLQELFLNGTLLLAYGGYFADMMRLKSKPNWLWDGVAGRFPYERAAYRPPVGASRLPSDRDFIIVGVIITIGVIAVILASTTGFQRNLRLYDYGPPLFAGLLTIIAMAYERATQGKELPVVN